MVEKPEAANATYLLAEACYSKAEATRACDLTSTETWDDWALSLDATLEREAEAVLV